MYKIKNPGSWPFGVEKEENREYFEVLSHCSLCEEEGIQPGHPYCFEEEIPEGCRVETEPLLTSAGWVLLVSKKK